MCIFVTLYGNHSPLVLLVRRDSATVPMTISSHIPQPLHLPLPAKPRQAGLAGEELLHGGLFEVALLGDELVELGEQGIHIRQRGGDGALFGEGWQCSNSVCSQNVIAVDCRYRSIPLI